MGALGSRKTQAARVTRLKRCGALGRRASAFTPLIGLEIGAEGPAEIAVSILSEIVKELRGASIWAISAPSYSRPDFSKRFGGESKLWQILAASRLCVMRCGRWRQADFRMLSSSPGREADVVPGCAPGFGGPVRSQPQMGRRNGVIDRLRCRGARSGSRRRVHRARRHAVCYLGSDADARSPAFRDGGERLAVFPRLPPASSARRCCGRAIFCRGFVLFPERRAARGCSRALRAKRSSDGSPMPRFSPTSIRPRIWKRRVSHLAAPAGCFLA